MCCYARLWAVSKKDPPHSFFSEALSLINVAPASNGFYFNSLVAGVDLIDNPDATDFIAMFSFKFAVKPFYVRAKERFDAYIINALINSSLSVFVLFFVIFISFVRNEDFIHLL